MNIILSGGSGAPNYVDELILRNWLSYIADNHPDYSLQDRDHGLLQIAPRLNEIKGVDYLGRPLYEGFINYTYF